MASEQFVAFQQKMAANPVPPPAQDIVELRARIDELDQRLVEVLAERQPCLLGGRAEAGERDPDMEAELRALGYL